MTDGRRKRTKRLWTPRLVVLAALLMLVAVSPSPSAAGCGRGECSRERGDLIRVPDDYGTIQGAIEAAPDGATILLAAGIYNETLKIEAKRLRIIGAEEGRTEIASFSRDVDLLELTRGGAVELKDLSLRGGAAAVRGVGEGDDVPGEVALKNVGIADGYRGIFGSFSTLLLKDVAISGTAWHGISLTHVAKLGWLKDSTVYDTGGVGIFVSNFGPGDVDIELQGLGDNPLGGIYVYGANGKVSVKNVLSVDNGIAAVFLREAWATIESSSLQQTHPDAAAGLGSGLLAVHSFAAVSNTIFYKNVFGVLNHGSHVAIANNVSDFNVIDFASDSLDGVPATWADQGGNLCGIDVGTPDEVLVTCQPKPFSLEPPAPIPTS